MKESNFVRNLFAVVGAIILLGLIGFLAIKPYLTPAEDNTITVSGTSEMTVAPDKATVYISVESKKQTADEASRDNSEKITKITDALMALGVSKDDIETTDYYLDINREWVNNTMIENGYIARHTIKVSTSDFTKIGACIDAATKNGATSVMNVNFELSKDLEEQKKAEVIASATKNAKMKADTLASSLGKKLGKLVNVRINDGNIYYPYVYNFRTEASGAAPKAADLVQEATSISPQKLTVSTTVEIIYKVN